MFCKQLSTVFQKYVVWRVPWNPLFKSVCVLSYLENGCHSVLWQSEDIAEVDFSLAKPLILLLSMERLLQRSEFRVCKNEHFSCVLEALLFSVAYRRLNLACSPLNPSYSVLYLSKSLIPEMRLLALSVWILARWLQLHKWRQPRRVPRSDFFTLPVILCMVLRNFLVSSWFHGTKL